MLSSTPNENKIIFFLKIYLSHNFIINIKKLPIVCPLYAKNCPSLQEVNLCESEVFVLSGKLIINQLLRMINKLYK